MGFIAGSGFFYDDEVDICVGFNHPAVVVQPFFISNCLSYLLKKLMFLEIVFTSQCKAVVRSQILKLLKYRKLILQANVFAKIFNEF